MKRILGMLLALMLLVCIGVMTVSAAEPTVLTLDETVDFRVEEGTESLTCAFTPTETAMYRFTLSTGQKESQTLTLYDSNRKELSRDVSYNPQLAFTVAYMLQAGQTYYYEFTDLVPPANHSAVVSKVDFTAASGTIGSDLAWVIDSTGKLTISGTGEIPAYQNEYFTPWKDYLDTITAVVLEDGVQGIGNWAFAGLENLKSVTLPALSYIGEYAFYECFRLETVELVRAFRIDKCAFASCHSLKSINLSGVINLGDMAFGDCFSLTEVKLPTTLTGLGAATFYRCTSLKSIYIDPYAPNFYTDAQGVLYTKDKTRLIQAPGALEGAYTIAYPTTQVDAYAFDSCSKLTDLTITANLYELPYSAFRVCSSLKNVQLPGTLERIGEYCFAYCDALETIQFPGSLTNVGPSAFFNCKSLKNIGFNYGLKSLSANAFNGCVSLTEVNLPSTVGNIEPAAFSYCVSLKSVTLPDRVTQLRSETFAYCSSLETVKLPGSLTDIYDFVFRDCYALKEIELPAGVGYMGQGAFYCCTGLKKVTLPEGLARISTNAFQGCFELETINFPSTLTSIGEYAFHACEKLKTVQIPASVTSIEQYAFAECIGLEELNIPGATLLQIHAFSDCAALKKVVLSPDVKIYYSYYEGIFDGCSAITSAGPTGSGCDFEFGWTTDIPSGVFRGMTGLTAVTLPNTVTTIGERTFAECTSLTRIELPASVTSIGNGALYGCSALTGLTIPAGVTEVAPILLENCTSLTSVTIPETVTAIGAGAMRGCTSLKSVKLPSGLTTIDTGAFANTALESIDIPAGVTRINQWAFRDCTALKTVSFQGSAPSFESRAFEGVTANATHPAGDATWTEQVKKLCGGLLTWVCQNLAHTWQDWQITTAPDCVTAGEETRKCAFCDATETRTAAALGHDYNAVVTAPTCKNGGYTTYTCNRCWDSYRGDETQPTGHTYGEWIVMSLPTCVNRGRDYRVCTSCKDVEDRFPDTVPHNWSEPVVWQEATCTKQGYSRVSCSVCGFSKDVDIVEPTGHTPNSDWYSGSDQHYRFCVCGSGMDYADHTFTEEVVKPTCISGGYSRFTCTVCGYSYEGSRTDPTEHAAVSDWEKVGAGHWRTCTCGKKMDEGEHVYTDDADATCDTCGYEREIEAEEPVLPGDVDNSGTVDFFDGMLVLQYYAGLIDETALNVSAADVDNSGDVSFFDGMYILQFYAGILEKLPVEG